ncbi:UNVERIFIED_CONTAM: hypothetical protein Slati_2659300 [Sesamum latifolium]|uniref:DUF4283 domain-containing protein n=1 Tax=Sesamum latifolium TaxID=2727402 RepID=A0AAW2VWH2_9LAMI
MCEYSWLRNMWFIRAIEFISKQVLPCWEFCSFSRESPLALRSSCYLFGLDRGSSFIPAMVAIPLVAVSPFFWMMDAFCQRLGRKLVLSDREGSRVLVPTRLWEADSESHLLFLVGRLLSSKQPIFEALASSVQSMLNPVKGLEMRSLKEGHFLIRFNHVIDRNRALEGYP